MINWLTEPFKSKTLPGVSKHILNLLQNIDLVTKHMNNYAGTGEINSWTALCHDGSV